MSIIKKRLILSIFSFVLLSITILFACLSYTDKSDKIESVESIKPVEMVVTEGKGTGIQLFSSTTSTNSSSVKITAALDSEYSTTKLTWTASWKNPSDSWVTGKTLSNYITFSPASNTLSCTVTNKSAFGSPIIITAKANDSDLSASCELKYAKRIESLTFRDWTSGSAVNISGNTATYNGGTFEYGWLPVEGIGTSIQICNYSIEISINPTMVNLLKSAGITESANKKIYQSTVDGFSLGITDVLYDLDPDRVWDPIFKDFYGVTDSTKLSTYNTHLKNVLAKNPTVPLICAKITYIGTYSVFESDPYYIKIGSKFYNNPTKTLSMDMTKYIF